MRVALARPRGADDTLFRADAARVARAAATDSGGGGGVPDNGGCGAWGAAATIPREPREPPDMPEVHYGIIASGGQAVRDGVMRDRLARELGGAICFETAAAGLMDNFPCLVVRGVCGYADRHHGSRWQSYAAGTAAAYAKELLQAIPPNSVQITRTIAQAMDGGKDCSWPS
jgi:nucleoside phosphorylase